MAIEPWSSFRAIAPQELLHDAPVIEVELQGVVQDADVLMGVRGVCKECSWVTHGDETNFFYARQHLEPCQVLEPCSVCKNKIHRKIRV